MPNINTSAFKGKIFHSKDFGQSHKFLTSDAVQNVTVVGGNKSSIEVARLCALAGKTVTWLIRPDGHGPGIMLDARKSGKHISQLRYARWTSILKPGIYSNRDWWYYFLHSGQNRFGFWLTQWFWKKQMRSNTEGRYSKSKNGEML
jgi:dimethylaniline monooxygenase (N-oxide forming)